MSLELEIFLAAQAQYLQQEIREIPDIPHLNDLPVESTIMSLHSSDHWPTIDKRLNQAGLTEPERQIVHKSLEGVSTLEYPKGIFRHPTINTIREMTDEELMLLSHAGAVIDTYSIQILRKLFGRKEHVE